MKSNLYSLLACLGLFAAALPTTAQNLKTFVGTEEHQEVRTAREALSPVHLTAVSPEPGPCITDDIREEVRLRIRQNKATILTGNPHAFDRAKDGAVKFVSPIRPKAGFDDYGYHTINFLVDHNPSYNQHTDYFCGSRSYDWQGGNHEGVDFILWPYPWKYMQEEVMEIVAAAPGTIVDKRDGNFDMSCLNNGNPNWNGVVIEHTDGSQAWYWHFKSGAITDKEVGQTVEAGEYLGAAGSSGSSNWPHLHFEVYDSAGELVDPFEGPCNDMNEEGWWLEQEPYNVPTINRISTHYTTAFSGQCGQIETTYEEVDFFPGDSMVFRLFYRDLETGAPTHIKMTSPSGAVYYDWVFTSPWDHYATAVAYWPFVLLPGWTLGTYEMSATFGGNTYITTFNLLDPLSVDDAESLSLALVPNPASELLRVSGLGAGGGGYAITDITGRRLASGKFQGGSPLTVNVDSFAPGVYFFVCEGEGNTEVRRFVVNR